MILTPLKKNPAEMSVNYPLVGQLGIFSEAKIRVKEDALPSDRIEDLLSTCKSISAGASKWRSILKRGIS